jgi:hypothetical protein
VTMARVPPWPPCRPVINCHIRLPNLPINSPTTASEKNLTIVPLAAPRVYTSGCEEVAAVGDGLPPKPKGMHRTSYWKLATRFLRHEAAMDSAAAARFGFGK